MTRFLPTHLKKFRRGEAGQVLPIAALMMVVLTAMVGLAVDVGNIYLAHRELQASTDAAALAGAAQIPTATSASTVYTAATNASSASGGANIYNNLTNVQMVSGYPVMKCLTTMQTLGVSCVGPQLYNAIKVVQQATVPLYFARIIGKNSMLISATATAVKGGASSRPYNVALVLDTTLSMASYDSNCGNTQMQCTVNGTRQLLTLLDPCGTSQSTCSITANQATNSVVRVSIFTFPQIQTSTLPNYSTCTSNTQAVSYSYPLPGATSYTPGTTTYQLIPFQSDYRLSDTATSLNPSSPLANALGTNSNCSVQPTPNAGNYGTYYAATIYAAQAALVHEQTLFPDSQNVMIIVGDGDNNSPHCFDAQHTPPNPAQAVCPNGYWSPMPTVPTGIYPSYYGECGQAITAAQSATAAGTRVYSVAYGSPQTGCQYDQTGYGHLTGLYPNVTPCNEMAQLASASYYFFSDFQQSGSNSTCTAAQAVTSLNDIFLQIAEDLTVSRLVPDSVT